MRFIFGDGLHACRKNIALFKDILKPYPKYSSLKKKILYIMKKNYIKYGKFVQAILKLVILPSLYSFY